VPKIRRKAKSGKPGTPGAERNRRSKAWKAAEECRRRIRGIKIAYSRHHDDGHNDDILDQLKSA
jgi:hypothetical protein